MPVCQAIAALLRSGRPLDAFELFEVHLEGGGASGVGSLHAAEWNVEHTLSLLTKALSKLSVIENMRLGAPNQRGEKFLAGLFQLWRSEEQAITEKNMVTSHVLWWNLPQNKTIAASVCNLQLTIIFLGDFCFETTVQIEHR